ncbi:MAG: hypothetical protein P8144_13600 [Gammaproteobacteria bacterium]
MLSLNQSNSNGSSSAPYTITTDCCLNLSLAPPNPSLEANVSSAVPTVEHDDPLRLSLALSNAQSRPLNLNTNLEASAYNPVPVVVHEPLQAPQIHSMINLSQILPVHEPEQAASLVCSAETSSSTLAGVMASASNQHKRLNPESGTHQNDPRKNFKWVNSKTGQSSVATNTAPSSTLRNRVLVDPYTGKRSTAENAIPRYSFYDRRLVDPYTGKRSAAENAISYAAFKSRKLVDPHIGKASSEKNAIPRFIFYERKLVDPYTGKLSAAKNAIPRYQFHNHKTVDPETGLASNLPNAIPRYTYQYRKAIKTEINTPASPGESRQEGITRSPGAI